MSAEPDQLVEQLFDRALGLAPERRRQFLRQECSDETVIARVDRLLQHHHLAGNAFLGGTAGNEATRAQQPTLPSQPTIPQHPSTPQHVGRYTILGVLGEGGMGTVYEAEQDHPRRRVALKLIRAGLMTPHMLRRFEYEADVLGRLEHPGIARIYYAGLNETPLGQQPYFAMELIRGIPLDRWVERHNPPLKRRLELLIAICQAVHHAHTKGVIHRDLKPSNILVTEQGHPKVLDFGVARATDIDLQTTTLHTATGDIVGTLPYMAPEQAAGRAHDLDTSSDVYALGVIAYELLSGRMPYEIKGKPLHEAVRVICEAEPSRLSSIDRSLRGDVETIVQKALEKDRTRRYPTAGDLAADVRRYLDYEPITARRPGTWYQLRKFAGRNRLLVGGVAAILVVLVLGMIGTTFGLIRAEGQKREAQQERARAQAVVSFLTENVLAGASPDRIADKGVRDTIVRVMLDPVANSVGREFANEPLVEAAVRNVLAQCYLALGRPELGRPHAITALEIRQRMLGDAHGDLAESLDTRATFFQGEGKFADAESLFRRALAMRRQVLGPDDPKTIDSINNLALVLRDEQQFDQALPLLRQAVEKYRHRLGETNERTLGAMCSLAQALQSRNELAEAEDYARKALNGFRAVAGEGSPRTLIATSTLAAVLYGRNNLVEAEDLFRKAMNSSRERLGADHRETLVAMNDLALVLQAENKLDECEPLALEVVERRRANLPSGRLELLQSIGNLARVMQAEGKLDRAEPLFREALDGYRDLLGNSNGETLKAINNLGMLLNDLHRQAEAAPLFQEVYQRAPGSQLPASMVAILMSRYGVCLFELNRYAEAEPPLLEAGRRLRETGQEKSVYLRAVVFALAQICDHTNRPEEAARWRSEP